MTNTTELALPNQKLDLNRHLPYILARTSNMVASITSTYYLDMIENAPTLSLREFRVIIIVAVHGPSAPAQIAELTGMDRATVTRAVNGLRKQGLVLSMRNARDARGKYVAMTSDGSALCERLLPLMAKRGSEIEEALTGDEIIQLLGLLSKIRHRVGDIGYA